MKFIENKINNFSKPYVAPRIRIVGVDEEGGLLAGSITGGNGGTGEGTGATPGGHAKQFSFRPIEDEETEY